MVQRVEAVLVHTVLDVAARRGVPRGAEQRRDVAHGIQAEDTLAFTVRALF